MWNWLEKYLDLPQSASGDQTSWKLLWDRPWPAWMPDWLGVSLIAALIAVALASVWRETSRQPARTRGALLALRLAVMLLVVVFLVRPVLSVNRTVEPVLAILIDTSESMGLQDEYEDPQVEQRLADVLKAANLKEPSRLHLALAVLLHNDGEFLRQLLQSHKLRVYEFSENAELLSRGEVSTPDDVDKLLQGLRLLEPKGGLTRPGDAVKQVLNEMKGSPPATMLIFSDGIATGDVRRGRGSLSQAVDAARTGRTALWTVGTGTTRAARDLELVDVQVPELAYLLDPIEFDCVVKSTGFEGGTTTLRLSILQTGQLLAEQEIAIPASGKTSRAVLSWQPDRSGDIEFAIELSAPPDDIDPLNQRMIRKVNIRETPLKVLLVERIPRFEYRYLKEFLEREPSVALSTVLLGGDLEAALQDRSGQQLGGRFPVREDQLREFDAILLGDVAPQELGPGVLQLLNQFVAQDGGALVCIAGNRFNPQAYKGTPLEPLLPVRITTEPFTPPARWRNDGFRPQPTLAGLKGTPVFRGLDEPRSDGRTVWELQEGWYRYFPFPEIKPGAIVWLTTDPPADDRPPLPLLIEQRFGTGKVLFAATDETWRLRQFAGDRDFGRLWLQTLRHLTQGSRADEQLELTTDRRLYERGESVEFRLRHPAMSSDGAGAQRHPAVRLSGAETLELRLNPDPNHPELFSLPVPSLPEGEFQAQYTDPESGRTAETRFRIVPPQQELRNRNLDETELMGAAEQTGGRYVPIGDAAALAARIPPGPQLTLESLATQPLWNRWELLVLALGLLTAEWVLRKRRQLA